MMRTVHFRLDLPVLRRTLQAVPEMRVKWIQSDVFENRIRFLFWAYGDDFDVFEDELVDDPTVTSPLQTSDVGDRRLYQVELTDDGAKVCPYPLLVEQGCVVRSMVATRNGWDCRIGFPDERSVTTFFEYCSRHYVGSEIYSISNTLGRDEGLNYGLTDAQREALSVALDTGYFDVPRTGCLTDVGNRIGISENSASERIRRGLKTIIEEEIHRDTGDGR